MKKEFIEQEKENYKAYITEYKESSPSKSPNPKKKKEYNLGMQNRGGKRGKRENNREKKGGMERGGGGRKKTLMYIFNH